MLMYHCSQMGGRATLCELFKHWQYLPLSLLFHNKDEYMDGRGTVQTCIYCVVFLYASTLKVSIWDCRCVCVTPYSGKVKHVSLKLMSYLVWAVYFLVLERLLEKWRWLYHHHLHSLILIQRVQTNIVCGFLHRKHL